jgi:hypothetical protein
MLLRCLPTVVGPSFSSLCTNIACQPDIAPFTMGVCTGCAELPLLLWHAAPASQASSQPIAVASAPAVRSPFAETGSGSSAVHGSSLVYSSLGNEGAEDSSLPGTLASSFRSRSMIRHAHCPSSTQPASPPPSALTAVSVPPDLQLSVCDAWHLASTADACAPQLGSGLSFECLWDEMQEGVLFREDPAVQWQSNARG